MKAKFIFLNGHVILLSCLICLLTGYYGTVRAEQPPSPTNPSYAMGVFPFLPAARLEGIFAPIAAELSNALNLKIRYQSASTFVKFMARLQNQDFDIALVQPFDYVRIAAPAGYQPVAARNGNLGTVFVVMPDSPWQSLTDLKQKTIAMAPEVAALTYLAKNALVEAGLDPDRDVTIQYQEGHHSCLQQLVTAKAAACATGEPALRIFEKKMQVRLKILARTPTIPDILFVVHPRVPERDRETITTTLLTTSLSGVADDLKLLFLENQDKPFIPASDQDYEAVYKYWQRLDTHR